MMLRLVVRLAAAPALPIPAPPMAADHALGPWP
jgi:hypothetical protein